MALIVLGLAIGVMGVYVVANIKRMYAGGDGHVLVLAASIRSLAHLLCCFSIDADLVTVPTKVLREWADAGFPIPDAGFTCAPQGTRIEYREIELDQPWQQFNIEHELTTKGVETFAADYRATLYPKAG